MYRSKYFSWAVKITCHFPPIYIDSYHHPPLVADPSLLSDPLLLEPEFDLPTKPPSTGNPGFRKLPEPLTFPGVEARFEVPLLCALEAGREKLVRENASASSSADGTPNPVPFLGLFIFEGFTRAEFMTKAGGGAGGAFLGLRHESASLLPCTATWRVLRFLSANHSPREEGEDVGWAFCWPSPARDGAGGEVGKRGEELRGKVSSEAWVRLFPVVWCHRIWEELVLVACVLCFFVSLSSP